MNYQGLSTRRDFVAFLGIFWFLVRYYPILSAGLICLLFLSSFWERSVHGANVLVRLFTGQVKQKGAKLIEGQQRDKNIRTAIGGSTVIQIDEPAD
jgi:hypothetical protein